MDRCKSLEIFCFNILSSRANDSMERLAIVTIVFLPLTFIASYFSMVKNFTVLDQKPSFFWKISVPLCIFFFLIFAYSTLKRFFKFAFNLDSPPPSYMPREQFPPYIPANTPMGRPMRGMGGNPMFAPLPPGFMSYAPRAPSTGTDSIV
ncbi:hypothetical protein I203_105907 [Kwoniella mangroviensis CBS 8507]|uniref:uncharacterized protein n=1 Tax=Kwoniella mangroviensis CBS 8507 TaxID=1296122 RepID=UPI0030287069